MSLFAKLLHVPRMLAESVCALRRSPAVGQFCGQRVNKIFLLDEERSSLRGRGAQTEAVNPKHVPRSQYKGCRVEIRAGHSDPMSVRLLADRSLI